MLSLCVCGVDDRAIEAPTWRVHCCKSHVEVPRGWQIRFCDFYFGLGDKSVGLLRQSRDYKAGKRSSEAVLGTNLPFPYKPFVLIRVDKSRIGAPSRRDMSETEERQVKKSPATYRPG